MSDMQGSVVVIGSGHAGMSLVKEIRSQNKEISIILISKDNAASYYKPNISKALAMLKTPSDLITSSHNKISAELNIDVVNNATVHSIDPKTNTLSVEGENSSRTIAYQKLVLALGATPIVPTINGNAKRNILSVNNLNDYRIFREELSNKNRVLIMGAGFVGTEFASDLSACGYLVDVVDRGKWPLRSSMPFELGKAITESFNSTFVKWHFESMVLAANKVKGGINVTLKGGKCLQTDIILSAVGIRPNIELAIKAGLAINHGIIVNEKLLTSDKNIYALGDCAEISGLILPFINPASNAARALANTLLGHNSNVNFKNFTVNVKVPSCPTVISPSLVGRGHWTVKGSSQDWAARHTDANGNLIGFALTGKYLSSKNDFLQECILSTEIVA